MVTEETSMQIVLQEEGWSNGWDVTEMGRILKGIEGPLDFSPLYRR